MRSLAYLVLSIVTLGLVWRWLDPYPNTYPRRPRISYRYPQDEVVWRKWSRKR